MENNGRTFQQNLVWDRLSEGLMVIEAANDSLEAKASKIVAGSTGAITAISGVSMFPKSFGDIGRPEGIVLAILCLSVLLMFWFASRLWGPQPISVATTHDVNVLYDEYIAQSEDVAFNNALIDTGKSFEYAKWVNDIKGSELRNMLIVLQFQVVILGAGVLLKAFT